MFNKFKDQAKSLGQHGKKGFDATWRGLDKYVGAPMNALGAKMGAESFWPTTMDKECIKAARILRAFTSDGVPVDEQQTLPDGNGKKERKAVLKIPQKVLQEAQGIAIFTVFRAGFVWSGAGGSGVVMQKQADGSWGAPSGLLIHTIGFGFLAGVDVYDCVLILRNERAVNSFKNPKVTLGGELSMAAGPMGAGGTLESGIEGAPCWSYTKSKGLYAGVQLDGTIIIERSDENERFYQTKVSASEILEGRVPVPTDAKGLVQALTKAEGKATDTDAIPEGLPPSDMNVKVPQTEEELHKEAESKAAA